MNTPDNRAPINSNNMCSSKLLSCKIEAKLVSHCVSLLLN